MVGNKILINKFMKKFLLISFFTLHCFAFFGQSKDSRTSNIVISNVSVITMKTDEVLKNQDVLIQDGKIVSIEKHSKRKYKNSLLVDGKGKYIMPTLSDAHVHFPDSEKDFQRIMELNLINGVTKLRSMRGDWKHIEWRGKYNTPTSFYPKLYLSPPPIRRNVDFTVAQIEEFVKNAKDNGFDFIKILSIKSQPFFQQLDSICTKYNMNIGGHYPILASGNEINEDLLFNSNYTSFEHLGGLVDIDSEKLNKRIQLLKDKNIFISPTLSFYSIGSGQYSLDESRNLPGMEFIPKTTVDEWIESTRKYREKLGDAAYKEEVANELKSLEEKYQVIKKLNNADVPMILSPDGSSIYMVAGFGILGEMELLKKANLSNYEILKMPTVNFASFFKEDYGTIEVGKTADFMILDNNPLEDFKTFKNIKGVYFNNQFLDENSLQKMRFNLLQATN